MKHGPATSTSRKRLPCSDVATSYDLKLVLISGIQLRRLTQTTWDLTGSAKSYAFAVTADETRLLLCGLQAGGVTANTIRELLEQFENAEANVAEQIRRLLWGGFARYEIQGAEAYRPSAWTEGRCLPVPRDIGADQRISLHEDAYLRRIESRWVLASTECGGSFEIDDAVFAELIMILRDGLTVRDLQQLVELPQSALSAFVEGLDLIGCLEVTEFNTVEAATCRWQFADRLFHARSRYGRHQSGYGATYPLGSDGVAPPAFKDVGDANKVVDLPTPSMACASVRISLNEALTMRRSIRRYAAEPISVDDLSVFLDQACRVRRVYTAQGVEFTARPYPSGGALYELEIYFICVRCRGLAAGLYRYLAESHKLEQWSVRSGDLAKLLKGAMRASGMNQPPQILFIITARFPRIMWKYESVAYSLVLKHVGCVYQTMYLVGTALGLAPCALGGGDSDIFCSVIGTDFWEESSVGEFMLGSIDRDESQGEMAP